MPDGATIEDVPQQFFTEDVFKTMNLANVTNYLDKGYIEVDFTYKMPVAGQDAISQNIFGKPFSELDNTQRNAVQNQMRAKAKGGKLEGSSELQRGSIQLDPVRDFEDFNNILTAMGLDPISTTSLEQLKKNRAAKRAAGGGGAGGSFGSKYSGATGQTDSQRQN